MSVSTTYIRSGHAEYAVLAVLFMSSTRNGMESFISWTHLLATPSRSSSDRGCLGAPGMGLRLSEGCASRM
jgi:hypothetical protein